MMGLGEPCINCERSDRGFKRKSKDNIEQDYAIQISERRQEKRRKVAAASNQVDDTMGSVLRAVMEDLENKFEALDLEDDKTEVDLEDKDDRVRSDGPKVQERSFVRNQNL